jgi:bifunctional DNase/RNase
VPLVRMQIDSIRTDAKLGSKRVILLKQKSAERYLPIYVEALYADFITKMLQDQPAFKFIDDEVFNKLDRLLDMADSISLVIDGFEKGKFHAKLIVDKQGKSFGLECPIERALCLCVKGSGQMFVDEAVLEEAGIATKG